MKPGVLDVISLASERDVVVVFPSHLHMRSEWRMYQTACAERHGRHNVEETRGHNMLMHRTRTFLRWWVPTEYPRRTDDLPLSTWFTERELRRLRAR